MPVLNHSKRKRSNANSGNINTEHDLEVIICEDTHILESFKKIVPTFMSFQRQLPVGLFDGGVSGKKRWTPGGKTIGGTGLGIRLANEKGIKIYNLFDVDNLIEIKERFLDE